MFLLAGRAPLKVNDFESIQNTLCANSNGRMVLALLALSEQNAGLTGLLHKAEADRAARFDQIQQLTELLKESEADRAARFDQIQQLTEFLKESEADRTTRLDTIQELESNLAALQSTLGKIQATRIYRVLRRMGYGDY